MEIKVKLPNWEWFNAGNVYTGSLGTDPMKGILNKSSLQYKVFKNGTGHNIHLIAICRFELPWNITTNIDEARIGRFFLDDFGIEIAENWILKNYYIDNPEEEGIKTITSEKRRLIERKLLLAYEKGTINEKDVEEFLDDSEKEKSY